MNRHSASSAGHGPTQGAQKNGGEKRARILDAAVKIFAEKGFYNAKVSEIAHHAGVADGTIYLYFKSKDDLLISLFEDRMEQVNQNVRAALEGGGAPVEKLRRALSLHLELVEQNPQLAEVLTVELRQSTKFLKEYKASKFGEFLKLLAQPIEEGQREGSIRADLEAPVVARALFGALDELVLAWVLGSQKRSGVKSTSKKKGAYDLAQVAGQLADLFIQGLQSVPAAESAVGPAATIPGSSNTSNPSTTTTKRRAS